MGKIRFKLYYPEFSNIFLSLIALSEIRPGFGRNYRMFVSKKGGKPSVQDQAYLTIFRDEITRLTKDDKGLNCLMSIIFDHNVENLIMLKRKIEKEFGPFDCSRIDKVYLYFYQTLKADYLFFQLPIVTALTRLEQQLEDQKIAYHLEKFHKFIEKERLMKLDKHFFISCTYFGEGGKASFWRFEPNRILFNIPIVIT